MAHDIDTRERNSTLFWGFLAFAAAFVIGAFALASSVKNIRRADDLLTVTGSARRAIRADFVVWRVSLSTQNPALAPATQELQRYAERLSEFLRAQGIADTSVTVRPIQTFAVPEVIGEGRETGRVVAYRLSQSFEIRSASVDSITATSQRSAALIGQGVPLAVSPPEYVYTRLADIRIELLAEATKDARARANAIAQSAGGTVGSVREVRMGVFQITPRFSTEVSDYGINDVSSIDKDVTAVVRVSFALK